MDAGTAKALSLSLRGSGSSGPERACEQLIAGKRVVYSCAKAVKGPVWGGVQGRWDIPGFCLRKSSNAAVLNLSTLRPPLTQFLKLW